MISTTANVPVTNISFTTRNQSFSNATNAPNSSVVCTTTQVCNCVYNQSNQSNNQPKNLGPSLDSFNNLTLAAYIKYFNISGNNQTILNNTNTFNSTIVLNYSTSVYNILSNSSLTLSFLLNNITLLDLLLPLPPYGMNSSQLLVPILTSLNSNQSQLVNVSNCTIICLPMFICRNNTNNGIIYIFF